nr:hypothetical protein [Tanacetum cinerariifolium]
MPYPSRRYGVSVPTLHKKPRRHTYQYAISRLEEDRAHKRGKVNDWETATYGKIWDNEDVHDLRFVETKFPAIVFNDTLTSDEALSCEPTSIVKSGRYRYLPWKVCKVWDVWEVDRYGNANLGGRELSHVSIPLLRVCMCGLCRPPGILVSIKIS